MVPHHAIAAKVEVPRYEHFLAISAYLLDSQGLAPASMDMLAASGACIGKARLPFLLGADFNMDHSMVEDCGFMAKLGCALVAPLEGTCKGSSGN